WTRFINMQCGPDGNMYVIDWYDKQACHHTDPNIWDRDDGRIYKMSYRGTKPVLGVDLQKCSDAELVNHLLDKNEWYVRHARRILQERYGKLDGKAEGRRGVEAALTKIALENSDETRRLRALWAVHAVGRFQPALPQAALADKNEYVRGWYVQLALEDQARGRSPSLLGALAEMAKSDPSPVVRRYLASGLQRLPLDERWDVLT